MAEKKEWKDMTKSEKITGFFILGVIGLLIIFVVVNVVSSRNESDENSQKLAEKVTQSLDGLGNDMKSAIVSSPSGYQGNIIGVDPGSGDGEVKVNVSTHFSDSGDGENGGKDIARRVFNVICADVPELNSLYVKSSATGLDSKSIYRSESVCK